MIAGVQRRGSDTPNRSKAVFKLKDFLGLLKKIYLLIEKYVVVIGAIILILWFIDPIRTYLITKINITQEIIISISGIFLFVFWRLFVEVDSTLDSLSLKVDEITRTTTSDYLILGGLNNVYDTLEDVIEEYLSKPGSVFPIRREPSGYGLGAH
jgi:hypothetical protein